MAEAAGLIEAHELTKRFGDKVAVDHLSFTVEPGQVTGFLGPNGAGKSTTMRLICGLDRPQDGTATIGGLTYHQLRRPLRMVGALLEARSLHPGRSARNHLLFLAQTQGFPGRRVDEVLDLVGLRDVAGKRVGGFSLGMTQRLGIAAAMLGDPRVLLLDEPGNGLDPEGIRWVRNFMKRLAAEGRTVFVSSHLMSEMSVTADHLIVIGRGRLIADSSTQEFIQRSSDRSVLVRTPDPARLRELIIREGGTIAREDSPDGVATLVVTGLPAQRIGELAASASVVLHELTPRLASLEEAFMELTADSVEYGDHGAKSGAGRPAAGAAGPAGRAERAMTPAQASSAQASSAQASSAQASSAQASGGSALGTVPSAGSSWPGFGRLLRAEWTKIRSVQSTVWSLLAFVVVAVGFSTLIATVISHDWNTPGNHPNHARLLTDPTAVIFGAGLGLGQLAICVLGVIVITSEYTTGTIRASLLAVPTRLPVLAAKALVFAAIDFVVSAITVFAVFFITTAILRSHVSISLSQPGVTRAVIGAILYLTVLGLFAMSIGGLIRHTAGAIAIVIAMVIVVPPLVSLIPGTIANHVHGYLPTVAGELVAQTSQQPGDVLSPWQGFGVFCLWTIVLLAACGWLLVRRDA